jgi:hypothetical protein
MININSHVMIVLSEFLKQMRTNVSDYQTFYLEHSRSHFLQLENYFASHNRSTVIVSVSLTLNIWSKYITIYEYDAIYEHELVVNARVEITSSIFNFRVMSISDLQNLYFIEFLKKSDELNVRFNTEDVLRIYFDLKTRVNIESWNVVIIEILSYASQKDVCIFLFKKRNIEIEKYDSRDLNSLSINIIEITKIFEHVSRHFAHQIAIDYDL